MDDSEHRVDDYLRSAGFADIVYEPDGNVPPDFLVNRRIAVEVRRLNQNAIYNTGRTEGLEEVFIPLWQGLEQYLPTIGPSVHGESWYVGLKVRRPAETWHVLK